MTKLLTKTWWILTVKGIITFAFGLFAIISPLATMMTIAKIFSILLIISGLLLVFLSITQKINNDRSWKLTEGFIDIIIGVILMVFPEVTMGIFISIIAIWISFIGALQITNGYRLRSLFNHWWILVLNGVLAIFFALIVFTQPIHGIMTFIVIVGLQAMVFGGFLIISSLYLKKLIRDISVEIPHNNGDEANQELSYY